MSTAELIYEKAKILSSHSQAEALDFVDYLLTRETARAEAGDWAKFSGEQLARQYSNADSIYDQDEATP